MGIKNAYNWYKSILVGRYGSGAGDLDDIRIDASTNTIQTIEYEHHEIHSGSHYYIDGYEDNAINNVMDFTWQMPAAPLGVHWTWRLSVEAETLYQVYEGATATTPLANAITPLNNDCNSGNTSDTIMKYEVFSNLAAANAVTDVTAATLKGTGVIGAGRDGGFNSRSSEIIMRAGSLYCLRTTASAAGYQDFNMEWYEHTPKH